MNNLYMDISCSSLNMFDEELCGDHYEVIRKDGSSILLVLADGMGSGVKANILSTLTSKIISTMMAQDISIEECVLTVAQTLPVCKVCKIAYSTFTIIRITESREAEIFQYDNPHVIFLRDGKYIPLQETVMEIDGKTIYQSKIQLHEEDALIAVSDGAIHAGVGKSLNLNWQRDDVIAFMEQTYQKNFSAKMLSTLLINACCQLYGGKPGDDTTVCTIKVRKRSHVNLLIGPPAEARDVFRMMSLFFSKEGKHIVCGGTTSALAAEFLKKPLDPVPDYCSQEVPPIAKIEGVDLVTEGVITIGKVLSYAQSYLQNNSDICDWENRSNGASMLAGLLFEEATDISFYIGRADNPAYKNPELPFGFHLKKQLLEELAKCLKRMGKKVEVNYF